jgi:hypothetical protein
LTPRPQSARLRRRFIAGCWASLLIGWHSFAQAEERWEYQAELGGSWQQITERDEEQRLVEETGPAASVLGSASRNMAGWRFSAGAGYFSADLNYSGQTQFGAPLETETEWRGWQLQSAVEKRFHVPLPMTLGAALTWQERKRHIGSTFSVTGLKEHYETGWLELHGTLEPTGFATVSASAGCALSSEVRVTLGENFDPADVSVNDHCRASLASELRVRRWAGGLIFLKPYARWERYPETESVRLRASGEGVGMLYLPATEIMSFGITLGVRGF